MDPSPELGEHPLPPVRLYRPGKGAVPRDAAADRLHPPLYAGDFNNRKLKGFYYWEGLDPKNAKDEKLRLALHYGEERKPRCDLCERENRACMSQLGEKYKTTGCAFCLHRHFQCSQANSFQKSGTSLRKNKDPPVSISRELKIPCPQKKADSKVANEMSVPTKRPRTQTRFWRHEQQGRHRASCKAHQGVPERKDIRVSPVDHSRR